jgi:WD40 repeat protein
VRHAGRPGALVRLSPHESAHFVAVSPDGHWVATGAILPGKEVKVWDARRGRLVKVLPLGSAAHVAFSPDGKWLATDCAGRRLWAVGSWKEHPRPTKEQFYRLAFSPDGRILAGDTFQGVVRLTDPGGGREYARLEDPQRDNAQWVGFIPDGTRLVTVCPDRGSIHVWDLLSLRRELARRGLDWDLPPYPPPADRKPARTLRVKLDLPGKP